VIRLCWREIRNHPRFSAFFLLNLALGFMGFVALDAFELAISGALESRSRSFLGADLHVESRRVLSPEELAAFDAGVGEGAAIANATVLFSMAAGPERARLAEIYAVDPAFPLYGDIVLEDIGAVGDAQRRAAREARGAWIDPALLSQLGVRPGDDIQVGELAFRVQGVVVSDGGRASGGFSIAPRVYVPLEHLADTGLVATGSRVQYRRLYRLPEGAPVDEIARTLRLESEDPRIEVRSHVEATRELARAYTTVNDYLGLVALIAVFLAGLGAAYLFREHLARRVKDIAILVSLGATRGRAQRIFLGQLLLLSGGAALLACAFGALLLPAIARNAAAVLPVSVVPTLAPRSAVAVALLATVGSVSACLPLLARIRSLRPAELFA
jgi:putative ABC transport system permease protein